MDIISRLPDELLVKILSSLSTKEAMSTSILSRQWRFLWMWSPKLDYSTRNYSKSECMRLRSLLDINLPLHRAPVIESLRLDFLVSQFTSKEIEPWLQTAVSRNLRELEISQHHSDNKLNLLPSSLYTCKSLVTLKLNGVDFPGIACLPSVKSLQLQNVSYKLKLWVQTAVSPNLRDDYSYNNLNVLSNSLYTCISLVTFKLVDFPRMAFPSLKTLQLQNVTYLSKNSLQPWVQAAVSSNLRELEISYDYSSNDTNILPSSLYTCNSLVALKLNGRILVDVPHMACLPSLKTLQLQNVTYVDKDSLQFLLSNCPILEDLFVKDDDLRKFIVIVPSLQRLTLHIGCNLAQLVINTPSLRYLKLDYYNSEGSFLIENMPKLEEAYVDVLTFPYIERLIGSITSVKRLTLCQEDYSPKIVFRNGSVFHRLEHLKMCVCTKHAPKVLVLLLKNSPNLRALDLFEMEHHDRRRLCSWNRPNTVPECMLSSLQTFKWSGYLGRPHERDIVNYFLENARCLKTATILSNPRLVPTLDMKKELSFSSRDSSTCQLFFYLVENL